MPPSSAFHLGGLLGRILQAQLIIVQMEGLMRSKLLLFLLIVLFAKLVQAEQPEGPKIPPEEAKALILEHTLPQYPPEAKQQLLSGDVDVAFNIAPQGDVSGVLYALGTKPLARAAIEALLQWKFRPYAPKGKPQAVQSWFRFHFADGAATLVDPATITATVPDVIPGHPEKKIPPRYPPEAKAARVAGTVMFEATINQKGEVEGLKLLKGNPLLVSSALEAVSHWRYTPFLQSGKPIPVENTIRVVYSLEGSNRVTESSPPAGTPEALGGKASADPIVPGTIIKKVEPEYPSAAKAEGKSGTVTLRIAIDKKGNVTDVRPMGGDPVFFDSAIKAVKQWKYTPSTVKGKPVDAAGQLTLEYKIPPVTSSSSQKTDSH
jgi:TonB family protein